MANALFIAHAISKLVKLTFKTGEHAILALHGFKIIRAKGHRLILIIKGINKDFLVALGDLNTKLFHFISSVIRST